MSVTERLDRMHRRIPCWGSPLAVLYKFVDDQGSYLAALITYYGFLSLFPLLLLMTSMLGFVLGGDAHLQQRVLNSTLSQFPVIGSQLGDPKGLRGSGAGLVIGLLGAVYGGLGVAQAGQNATNTAWHMPRNNRPNPIRSGCAVCCCQQSAWACWSPRSCPGWAATPKETMCTSAWPSAVRRCRSSRPSCRSSRGSTAASYRWNASTPLAATSASMTRVSRVGPLMQRR